MININLIAERRARKVREISILRMSVLGVFLVILAMGLLNTVAYIDKVISEKALAQVTDELAIVTEEKVKLDLIKAEISEKEPVVTLLKQVQLSEAAWMIILADFTRVIPDNVSIGGITTTMTDEGVELNVAGVASDEETVGEFMLAIREKTRWAKTPTAGTISAVDDNPDSGVRFSLTIPVRGLYGGELQ